MAWIYAYIDCQNIHMWTTNNWRTIDRDKFFVYLKQKFNIDKAYMFIWLKKDQKSIDLYNKLSWIWYTMKLRHTVPFWKWQIKWNIDWDLIVQAMLDCYEWWLTLAYLITSDWDFNSLVKVLKSKKLLWKVLTHNIKKTSSLLKKEAGNLIQDLSEIKDKISE